MHKHLACIQSVKLYTLGVIIFLGLWQGLNDKYSPLFYYSWQLCIWGEECSGPLYLSSLKSHHRQPPSHEELWDRQSVPGSGGNATVWHLTPYQQLTQQLTQLLFLKEKLQLFLFSVVIAWGIQFALSYLKSPLFLKEKTAAYFLFYACGKNLHFHILTCSWNWI